MSSCIAVGLMMMTFAGVGGPQDTLAGTWEGETGGGASIVLTLAVKGTVLTGTLVRSGKSATLSDGAVSKNSFTFKTTLDDQPEALSGEVSGDEIKIWLDRQGPAKAIILRRVMRKQVGLAAERAAWARAS